jgi:hypothetical protein
MPNLESSISLRDLCIDTDTLYIIKNYLCKCNYEPTSIENLQDLGQEADEIQYLKLISEEKLLLVTLASHKLGLQSLQNLACARIAQVILKTYAEDSHGGLELELGDQKQLDFYLKKDSQALEKLYNIKQQF